MTFTDPAWRASAIIAVVDAARRHSGVAEQLTVERSNLRDAIRNARQVGCSQQQIADVLGVTRQRVSQLEQST